MLIGYALAVTLHALWNGSASLQGGAAFLGVYAFIMVPLLLAMIVVVIWQRRREQRVVIEQLPGFAQAGWIAPSEIPLLSSLAGRRGWRAAVRRRSGKKVAKAVNDYQSAVTDLAFLRSRMSRGSVGSETGVFWHGEALAELARARNRAIGHQEALTVALRHHGWRRLGPTAPWPTAPGPHHPVHRDRAEQPFPPSFPPSAPGPRGSGPSAGWPGAHPPSGERSAPGRPPGRGAAGLLRSAGRARAPRPGRRMAGRPSGSRPDRLAGPSRRPVGTVGPHARGRRARTRADRPPARRGLPREPRADSFTDQPTRRLTRRRPGEPGPSSSADQANAEPAGNDDPTGTR